MRDAALARIRAEEEAKAAEKARVRAISANRKAFLAEKAKSARDALARITGAGDITMSYRQVKDMNPCSRLDALQKEFHIAGFEWGSDRKVSLRQAVELGAKYDDITWLMCRAAPDNDTIRYVWSTFKLATRDMDSYTEREDLLMQLVAR